MAEVLARLCEDASSPQLQSSHSTQTGNSISKNFSNTPNLASPCSTSLKSRIPTSLSSVSASGIRNIRSPRCEAFVMTGDKMLILNPKISPHYAKLNKGQLPPSIELYDGEGNNRRRGPFDDFIITEHEVSKCRNTVDRISTTPTSQSDHCITEFNADELKEMAAEHCDDRNFSQRTLLESVSSPYNDDYDVDNNADAGAEKKSAQNSDSHITEDENRLIEREQHSAKRSLDATSSPLKNQSFTTTITAGNTTNLPASDVYYGSASTAALHSNDISAKYINGKATPTRRMPCDDSLSDVTTTVSISMPRAETIVRIATQLFTLQGYTLADVSNFLMKKDCELSQRVVNEFMHLFNFSGKRLDVALREFLNHVSLTGETSERADILTHFSASYFKCNPTLFEGIGQIHGLVCALILLNTDLHGANVTKKMTMREFVDNLLHTQYNYDRNTLKTLYNAVKEMPFLDAQQNAHATTTSTKSVNLSSNLVEQRHRRDMSVTTGISVASPITPPQTPAVNPLLRKSTERSTGDSTLAKKKRHDTARIRDRQDQIMFVNPREQADYKRGWLLKKSVYDPDGRRTPFGRRKWQMCYATLCGMTLYLHKNEKVFERSRYETFANCIRLHHSMAEVARDYKKRQHVFRLRTASFGEILFETSESKEVQRWIDVINYVAAAFSMPPLPVAISSVEATTGAPPAAVFRFTESLPATPTTLSMPEQLRAHCERLDEVTEALAKLRAMAPSIKAKGKSVYEYFYRERYLDKERERYSIYVSILDEKLGDASQLNISSTTSIVNTHIKN